MPAPTAPEVTSTISYAGLFQCGDLRDKLFQLRRVNQLPAVGEDAGAEFYDEARNGFEEIAMHAVKLGKIPAAKKAKLRGLNSKGAT